MLKELRKGESTGDVFELSNHLGAELFRETKEVFKPKKDQNRRTDDAAIESVEKKMTSPIVETNIRIVASSRDERHAEQLLSELEAAFNQYENTKGNRFEFKRMNKNSLKRFVRNFSYRLFSHEGLMPLSLRELTTVYHFPPKGIKSSPHLMQSRFTAAAAPLDLPKEGVLLGSNNFRGINSEIHLSPLDRMRHLYMIGQTGTGKTVFMKNLIIQDIKAGNGVCFIDPHGNDILDVLANEVE